MMNGNRGYRIFFDFLGKSTWAFGRFDGDGDGVDGGDGGGGWAE